MKNHIQLIKVFFILFTLLWGYNSYAQPLQGKVINGTNGNPLAFVNILFDHSGQGVSCDIDGRFTIDNPHKYQQFHFTYVGFQDTSISSNIIQENYIVIRMYPKSYQLKEVQIFPGENPAHRIIRNCVNNRKLNNPEKRSSFSYKAYHKMVFTAKSSAELQPDSIIKRSSSLSIDGQGDDIEALKETFTDNPQTSDTIKEFKENFFKSQHLFLMESVTERKYKRPDKNYEKVIGTRVSGLKDPLFALVATQFQSFSFYKPEINILDKNYINPISPGSWNKYYFLLEDTLYKGQDSIFVISFRPFKNKKFDGMTGVLYINNYQYAIQNVIAKPVDIADAFSIKIQQKYVLIDGSYWFPVQLNTNIEFNSIMLNRQKLVGIGKTYLEDIQIDIPMKKQRFNNVILDIDRMASKQDSSFWNQNRALQLDSLEIKTYRVIDSIGEEEHFDHKLWVLRTLTNGYIPWGPINIELDKFFQYNEFEGFRMGASLKTNDKMARWVQLGAYGAWSTKDKQWKYGGSADFILHAPTETHLLFQYQHDVLESASQESFSRNSFYNTNLYRNFLIREMNYTDALKMQLGFRAIPNFKWKLGLNIYEKLENYPYLPQGQPIIPDKQNSTFQELYIETRYAYKEKIIRNPLYQVSLGTKYPILNIRYTYGQFTNQWDNLGTTAYNKLDLQLSKSFFIRYLGKSSFLIRGGLIQATKNIPWYQLFNGRGNYASFYLESPNSFGTMRMNEFLVNQYISIFYRHDFGTLLFGDKEYIPQPEFISSFIIGSLPNDFSYPNIEYQTLEKGYYESGIMLNSILRSGFSTIGIGAFYRYGAYAFKDESKNFAFKFSLKFTL